MFFKKKINFFILTYQNHKKKHLKKYQFDVL
jgi:hypothetical protein